MGKYPQAGLGLGGDSARVERSSGEAAGSGSRMSSEVPALAVRRQARLLRRRSGGEDGSILVMFALFVSMFALLCAVVVDVGYWWVIGKKAQIAADACALAAAGQLPASWDSPPRTECMVAGVDYAKTNLPLEGLANEPRHTATVVRSPYPGGAIPASYVEAKVTLVVRTFFGRVVGLDHLTLTRRAVAEQIQGAGNYAIYSHNASCSEGLEFNGNVHAVNGRVHSNGQYLVNNGGSQPFWAKVGTRAKSGCGPSPSSGVRFGGTSWTTGTPGIPTTVGPQAWPEWFTQANFTCTVTAQKIEISGSDFKINGSNQPYPIVNGRRVIPSGTYCATELFQINGDNIDGKITALAPKIEVNGNGTRLEPFAANGVLFFNIPNTVSNPNDGAPGGTGPLTCTYTEEMKLSNGNNGTWKGKVFHPCGRVLVNGNSAFAVQGAIYGLRVKVNGNGFTMTGTGGGAASKVVALVE